MSMLGKKHSKQTRERMSKTTKEYYKTHIHHLLGKKRPPFSKEWKKNISESGKKKKLSKEAKEQIFKNLEKGRVGSWCKGKKHSETTKKKMSNALLKRKKRLGYVNSPEAREKLSKTLQGHFVSKEAREKISKFFKGRFVGEKSPTWKGGISREPYSFDFNEELKELIRKRDNYICQLCGCPQEECFKKLIIHHIDYDKKNSNPDNLVALCNSCHSKTNHNRIHWKQYWTTLQQHA